MTPPPVRFLSPRRLGLAGASAVIACTVWCALPLLAGVGLGGLAAAILWPGAELTVGAVVFLVTLGAMAAFPRIRRRRADCSAPCGDESTLDRARAGQSASAPSYEAAPTTGVPGATDDPTACTLDPRGMQGRIEEYRAVFGSMVHAERFDHGFAWRFRGDAGVEARVRSLVSKEQECCRFFRFDVRREGAEIVWETRADDRAAAILVEFFHLPERLETRRHHDVNASMRRAGLSFPADARRSSGR